jgi:uncharacterized protein (DUF1800 family)
MKYRAILALVAVVSLASSKQISKDQKIPHALNRLTFGPRPGDAERVRAMGLKKWIDQQLHPERIPENPVLEGKLRTLDTLRMDSAQMAMSYPPPQLIRAMADGRMPLPSDPEMRLVIQKQIERFKRQLGKDKSPAPDVKQMLSEEEQRAFRSGPADGKLKLFLSFPEDKQFALLEAMPQGMRYQMLDLAGPDLRRKIIKSFGPQQLVMQDLFEGKLYRAIYSTRQLEEVLTDFWFNHFNVYLDKGADRYLVTAYERDAIRPYVLGKFKDMLLATAKSPAMLFYLDNWQSVDPNIDRGRNGQKARRGLNENYGRELLELHTLGVDGGYTQRDVTEVARCFTGWTIRDPQRGGGFQFNEKMHDKGEKIVLGVKIPADGGMEDGLKVLDIVEHHPSTARFLSKKLAMRFVADDPPASLVNKMAKTFASTGGDLRAVMKTMLNAPEFWSEGAFRSKMKSPLEMVASAVRALDANVDYAFALANQVAQLGEPLYRKQEPTGYSNHSQEWVNSAALLGRMNFALALASNRIPGVKVDAAGQAAGLTLGAPEFQRR